MAATLGKQRRNVQCEISFQQYYVWFQSSCFLFEMLRTERVPNFESLAEFRLKCDHSLNESYSAVLSCGAVYYAVQGASNV